VVQFEINFHLDGQSTRNPFGEEFVSCDTASFSPVSPTVSVVSPCPKRIRRSVALHNTKIALWIQTASTTVPGRALTVDSAFCNNFSRQF
jgi:hypothetical protein